MTAVSIANVMERRQGKAKTWTYDTLEEARHSDAPYLNGWRNKMAKPTNFLMVYGGSPIGLARKLIVPKQLAEQFYDSFHRGYPGIGKRAETVIKSAKRHGFSTTMYGNRRHCPDILGDSQCKAAGAERQVVNMEMQGTAADICKMVCRDWVLNDVPGQTGATLYAFVYDEIVASVPKANILKYIQTMAGIMEVTLPGSKVKLAADASFGPTWGEQHELGGNVTQQNIDKILETM